MPIQTVLFDMGGTIDTFWYSPEMRLAVTPDLQAYLATLGINLSLSDRRLYELITGGLERYHGWRLKTFEELPAYLIWCNYILADYPSAHPQLVPVADELMVWIETHYYQRRMRPEIPSVLNSIRQMGYKIGLISNVASRGQVPLNLEQYGIKHYFNPIVLSSEYKRRKPDPAIFHYAARLSNSPTSECVYIGDRIARDVVGAKRAGFKLAVQIKHDFNHGELDEGAEPDLVVTDMNEFLEVLQEIYQSSHQVGNKKVNTRNIKALLFDADGVLYYRKNKNQELNSFIMEYGTPCTENVEADIAQLRHKAFTGELTFSQYKTQVLKLYNITDPHLVAQGLDRAIKEKEEVHFFNDTMDTLETLKKRDYYLGIITDTAQPLHAKLNKLERGGIGHYWDSIIPSSEVGVHKPDPEIYHLALRQLGVSANQAVFVGHKSSELEGARNVGITTIAYNYDREAIADYYIDNFSELASLAIIN